MSEKTRKRPPRPGEGRPPKFKTPDEMDEAVEAYFKARTLAEMPPTMAGLAIALGFQDVASLDDQERRKEYGDEFSKVIKKAKLRIREAHESRLFGNNPTGSIFWLKTHGGLKETSVTEHSGSVVIVDDIRGTK